MKFNKLVLLLIVSGSVLADSGDRYIGQFVKTDENKASQLTVSQLEVLSRSRRDLSSDSNVTVDFDYSYISYARWDYTNISGSCKYLIFRVTTEGGYDELYHKIVLPWGTVSNPLPDVDKSGWVEYRPIASISCDSTAPGFSY